MKLLTAKELVLVRENLIGFLHVTQLNELENLLHARVDKLSFNSIADIIFEKYATKQISNKKMSRCIEIITSANQLLKEIIAELLIKDYKLSNKDFKTIVFYTQCGRTIYCSNEKGFLYSRQGTRYTHAWEFGNDDSILSPKKILGSSAMMINNKLTIFK